MKKINTIYFLAFFAVIFLASCTSSTRITSEPPGATVIIDGQTVGETPYVHEDSKISFSRTTVTLQKNGFEDLHTVIRKDEDIDPGAIVGGIFFQWPFIWTFGYLPDHHYVMSPANYSDVEVVIPDKKADQIQELNEMYKEGIIDKEEFDILKKRILGTGEKDPNSEDK